MRPIPFLRKGLLTTLLLLLCLPGCILIVEEDDDDLYRHRWRLDVIIYYGRSYAVTDAEPFTLSFATDGQFHGRADCNDYDGTFDTTVLGTLSIHEIYSTDLDCRRGSLEDQYFDVLSGTRSYRISGDALTLKSRNGDSSLHFYRY
ncbi:MAG: META domain-containing protein [Rhodothermales bacterium]